MQDDTIYCKTRKGIEEIAYRSNHLPGRLRSALIQVDGHTPWLGLQARLMLNGEAAGLMDKLLADGYIEELSNDPPTEMEM